MKPLTTGAEQSTCCPFPSGLDHAPVENSLSGFFTHLFDTSSYPARWNCGGWTSIEGWLHIASDIGIFAAYFAIPVALIYFVSKRKDIPFNRIFLLFASFILFCGAGHLLDAVVFYYPIYRVAGLLKLATAIVSLGTFLVLLRLIPKALEVPALVTKNELLQKADATKSEFLANMSHEIRTPMTAILGYTELLYEEGELAKAPPARIEAIQTIRRNGEHLLEIINDILDISKIESGTLELECQSCSPVDIVNDVISLMKIRAKAKGIQLAVQFETRMPATIQTDPTRLRQILVNLIGNAVKFTEAGRVDVVLRTSLGERPQLEFDVVDTGTGVPTKLVAGLFKPFAQADNSTTRKFGGTGLGLSISQRLARRLGGDVVLVSSIPTVGSKFRAIIDTGPIVKWSTVSHRETNDAGMVPVESPQATNSAQRLQGCRILFAEDGPDNQRLISHILKKSGAEIEVVENGELAVSAALQQAAGGTAFDVILMDMQMPVLDGYAATASLRQQGYDRPIIALTAHAMQGAREECLEAGCDDFATKPINRTELADLIISYWKGENMYNAPQLTSPALVSEMADDEDMIELIEMFVDELPDRVSVIEEAVQQQDTDGLKTLAHQLKGSAGGYGFPSITTFAASLEASIKSGEDFTLIEQKATDLVNLCRRATATASAV